MLLGSKFGFTPTQAAVSSKLIELLQSGASDGRSFWPGNATAVSSARFDLFSKTIRLERRTLLACQAS